MLKVLSNNLSKPPFEILILENKLLNLQFINNNYNLSVFHHNNLMRAKLSNEEMDPMKGDSPPVNKVTPFDKVISPCILNKLNDVKGRSNKKQSE